MRVDTFNKPSHYDITSVCKIFSHQMQQTLVLRYLSHFFPYALFFI